jgi:hypothetical protein
VFSRFQFILLRDHSDISSTLGRIFHQHSVTRDTPGDQNRQLHKMAETNEVHSIQLGKTNSLAESSNTLSSTAAYKDKKMVSDLKVMKDSCVLCILHD